MTVPKVFTSGEKIKASDFNENFEHVEDAKNLLVPSTGTTGTFDIPFIDGGAAGSLGAFSEDLAEAIDDGLDTAAVFGGIGSNVVQAVKTDTFATSSTSFETVTGLTATITPSSPTARMLIIAQINISGVTNIFLRLNGGNSGNYVGDADQSRARIATGLFRRSGSSFNIRRTTLPGAIVFMDAPNTTDPVTYELQARHDGGTGFVNRAADDGNSPVRGRSASSFTVIEVAA